MQSKAITRTATYEPLFLSYTHKNTDLAKVLASVRTKGGQSVWWDDQLRVGPKWQDQMADQIRRANAIVLITAWLESTFFQ